MGMGDLAIERYEAEQREAIWEMEMGMMGDKMIEAEQRMLSGKNVIDALGKKIDALAIGIKELHEALQRIERRLYENR